MPIPSMKWKGLGQAPGLAPWSSGLGAATRCYRHFLFTLSRAGWAGITPGNVTIGDVRHGKWKLERTNTSSWGGHTLTECTKHRIWKYAMEMSGLGKCFLALLSRSSKMGKLNFEQMFTLQIWREFCEWLAPLQTASVESSMLKFCNCWSRAAVSTKPSHSQPKYKFWIRNARTSRLQAHNPNQQTKDYPWWLEECHYHSNSLAWTV